MVRTQTVDDYSDLSVEDIVRQRSKEVLVMIFERVNIKIDKELKRAIGRSHTCDRCSKRFSCDTYKENPHNVSVIMKRLEKVPESMFKHVVVKVVNFKNSQIK